MKSGYVPWLCLVLAFACSEPEQKTASAIPITNVGEEMESCDATLFTRVAGVVASDDIAIVADRATSQAYIVKWQPCRVVVATERGEGPNEVKELRSASRGSHGTLLLFDARQHKVLAIDSTGSGVESVRLQDVPLSSELLGGDERGRLFFETRPVVIGPSGPVISDSAKLVVVEGGEMRLLGWVLRARLASRTLSSSPQKGQDRRTSIAIQQPFQPEDPVGVDGYSGEVWTISSSEPRVTTLNRTGLKVDTVRAGKLLPVGPSPLLEGDKLRVKIPPDYLPLIEWPSTKPAFASRRIIMGTGGQGIVRLGVLEGNIGSRYLVVDRSGSGVEVLQFKNDFELEAVSANWFYGTWRDEDDQPVLARYRR